MSLVSIIIPTYNRSHILTATIESIINQTFKDWELLIVDDGSTDDTEAVVIRYTNLDKRIRFISRPEHLKKGANTCRNIGFTESKGKYIKWVDSDDLLDRSILELQVLEFQKRPDIDLVVCNGAYFTEEGGIQDKYWSKLIVSENLLYDYIRNTVRWHVCGCLWRKSFFESPPYRIGLMNAQEWLMHSNAILKKPKIKKVDSILFYVRQSSTGRISTNRTSNYFMNAAKARCLLLREYCKISNPSPIVTLELVKQISVFLFHTVKSSFYSQK